MLCIIIYSFTISDVALMATYWIASFKKPFCCIIFVRGRINAATQVALTFSSTRTCVTGSVSIERVVRGFEVDQNQLADPRNAKRKQAHYKEVIEF